MRLIDADELLKAIANSGLIWETNECLDVIETLAVKKIIDDAPTVNTTFREVVAYECGQKSVEERPTGEWEYNPEWDEYMCPFCCAGFPKEYNFCPNCGAEMRGDVWNGKKWAKEEGDV